MEPRVLEIRLPAEWEPQSGVMLTWPHEQTDWAPLLDEVEPCFVAIAQAVVVHERLLIVCRSVEKVRFALGAIDESRILFCEIPSNDTWARDHGPITVFVNETPYCLDFTFNGWGLKFPANEDNQITRRLFDQNVLASNILYQSMLHVILEGGSIESDGAGTMLTTSQCLLSVNRNEYKSRAEIADYFQMIFGIQRILWLNHGYLAGDDTDSHIDTLARFCDQQTIAYVQCNDPNDEHYNELALMEKELHAFRTLNGEPYRFIALPMAEAVYDEEGKRLPATYANFLIINDAVLIPTYNSPLDEIAQAVLQTAFPDRKILGINCLPLIKQHGSLHCVTMQFPEGILCK